MSLKTALYAAKAEGAHRMAVINPECYDEADDEFDVGPTMLVKDIMGWWGQSDDFQIVFWNDKGVKLGHWVIYQGEDGIDWLQDCDTGDWSERVSSGHEVEL